nr:hypothetical protein [uncultured Brevundimonas sp.]
MIASRSHLHAPFRTLAAGIAAVLGLAGQAQAQSLTPDEAPEAWVAYAENATRTLTTWLEADEASAIDLRQELDQLRSSPDQPTESLELRLWVSADGVVTRVEPAPRAPLKASAALRGVVDGRRLPPPPKGMLQPLRLAVQLEPPA